MTRKNLDDPYMKRTFAEAAKLMSKGHHKQAINAYAECLQQVVMVTTVKYYHYYNHSRSREMQSTFATKSEQNITMGYVISKLPKKLRSTAISQNYKYNQDVRNDVSAHPYYALSLSRITDTWHEMDDVNTKRKYIRRLYKHVKCDQKINYVESFLRVGSPMTIYSKSDQLMLECERLVLETLSDNVKSRLERIKKCLERELALQTLGSLSIDYWIDDDECGRNSVAAAAGGRGAK